MKNTNSFIYNSLAILFFGLTIFAFLCTLLMFARVVAPPPFLRPNNLSTPTVVLYPTETISPTPSDTPIPSRTPFPSNTPILPTETPAPTLSLTPSVVPPSATPLPALPTAQPSVTLQAIPTLPPVNTAVPPTKVAAVPTNTRIPTNTRVPPTTPPTRRPTATRRVTSSRTPVGQVASRTPSDGPTPTLLPTRAASNQPFIVEDGYPTFGANPDFQQACNFLGIAGVVTDLGSQPLRTKFRVRVTKPDKKVIETQPTPQNDALFTPGSWVAQIAEKPATGSYVVQLFNSQNRAVSDAVQVEFKVTGPEACNTNVAYVNFIQVKPATLP